MNYQWDSTFVELFERCLERYRSGDEDFNGYYTEDDIAFLKSIGYKPRELFDFVEDLGDGGVPTLTTALMIASVRRDYFHVMMKGEASSHEIKPDELPGKEEGLEGLRLAPPDHHESARKTPWRTRPGHHVLLRWRPPIPLQQ